MWYPCVPVRWDLTLPVPKLAVFPECCRSSLLLLGRVCYRCPKTGSHVGAVVYVSSIAQGSSVVVPAEWLKCLKAGEASECTSCADSRDQAVAVQSWGTGVLSGPGGEELAESSLLLGQEEWPQIHLILCVQKWVLSSADVLLVDIWATVLCLPFHPCPLFIYCFILSLSSCPLLFTLIIPTIMWTKKFQIYKLDLEKAKEPEIKFPAFIGS